ncbi:MAG: hypothetical protein PCFJNLEI_00449 [Verrucomicrobiae bacterium]|nr:hypothetical protein [Verrucomicrobiae bacterium]
MKRKTYRTPHEIAVKGFEALVEKLGPGGALQFIHQYETGKGDYTKERCTILKGVTLKKLRAELLPKK